MEILKTETQKEKIEKPEGEIELEKLKNGAEVRGVLFIPHTQMSELGKRIRGKLKEFENISVLRVKVVERAGEKVVDALHKSNPWDDESCLIEDCLFCYGNDEKMIGKCKQRGVVYETLCMLCERKRKGEELLYEGVENKKLEKTGEKRKREDIKEKKERMKLRKRKVRNRQNILEKLAGQVMKG